ncbi:uncharacterized protein TNCV_651571 [Trichonephila clavipes]|nr:uncharacterized protein TNCV_651571 [Trichonephila clavipes]
MRKQVRRHRTTIRVGRRSRQIMYKITCADTVLRKVTTATMTESGKTSNLQHRCGRKKTMQKQDQRRLTRIIKRDICATFRKFRQILMLGHQQVSPCAPFNETSSMWAFGPEGPHVYPR